MENKEQIIREQRTIEAMRKGLMGIDGKFSIIAQYLGEEIWQQGGSFTDQTNLPDFSLEHDEIPTMDENEMTFQIGWIFNGLKLGIHMEISFIKEFRKIEVSYKGKKVYEELAGELERYVPELEWENIVNELLDKARLRAKAVRIKKISKEKTRGQKLKDEFIQKMQERWGL